MNAESLKSGDFGLFKKPPAGNTPHNTTPVRSAATAPAAHSPRFSSAPSGLSSSRGAAPV